MSALIDDTGGGGGGGSGTNTPHISVAVGVSRMPSFSQDSRDEAPYDPRFNIIVGLLASFVQSLGLTIQRKSHLANEALPLTKRKKDFKRPLWLIGFIIFIGSNLFGTIFQIGALPIVVLGPLGAVSLLWNALFARFILGDRFSLHLIAGIIFIAGGACLIGIFGVVPEQTHSLPELIHLYTRSSFVIWFIILFFILSITLTLSHLTEWALERRILKSFPDYAPLTPRRISNDESLLGFEARKRRVSHSRKGGRRKRSSFESGENANKSSRHHSTKPGLKIVIHHSDSNGNGNGNGNASLKLNGSAIDDSPSPIVPNFKPLIKSNRLASVKGDDQNREQERLEFERGIERSRLILGIAYGASSGTLSGLCLLFAKTGIELLILSLVGGENQFGHLQAWFIILILVIAALLQLFYLNRALRLVGPTLICPLAFCFYNLSSIISGVIYYDQWDSLSSLQFGLVSLGTIILLTGVWIVSIKNQVETDSTIEVIADGYEALRTSSEDELDIRARTRTTFEQDEEALRIEDEESDREEEEEEEEESDIDSPAEWIPRGLTIGLGAASPGFDLRPARTSFHHHKRSPSLPLSGRTSSEDPIPSTSTMTTTTTTTTNHSETPVSPARDSIGIEPLHQRKSTRHTRGMSLSGNFYVGRSVFSPSDEGHSHTEFPIDSPLTFNSSGLDSPGRRGTNSSNHRKNNASVWKPSWLTKRDDRVE